MAQATQSMTQLFEKFWFLRLVFAKAKSEVWTLGRVVSQPGPTLRELSLAGTCSARHSAPMRRVERVERR